MQYLTFVPQDQPYYRVAFLVKYLRSKELTDYYVNPLGSLGIKPEEVIAYALNSSLSSNKQRLEYFDEMLPNLCSLNTEYLVVCDAAYYKQLTKSTKVDVNFGYVKPCVLPGYEHLNVLYCPPHTQVFHNPGIIDKIQMTMVALADHVKGQYVPPGNKLIRFAEYPKTVERIAYWLERLIAEDRPLAVDIEAFGLKHYNAGIGTISFAWNEHEGIAFPVDLFEDEEEAQQVRELLKDFFKRSRCKKLYHHISYDVYVLIYQLFMSDLLDTAGMLDGMEYMLSDWEDTRIIAYLATNNCRMNRLKLKEVAQEFAGNYAQDVKDIRKIDLDVLLEYNLTDSLSTWYAYNKHHGTMVADQQEPLYLELFKPMMWDIIQMQLTGMPLDMEAVVAGAKIMQADSDAAVAALRATKVVQDYELDAAFEWAAARNAVLKKKRVTHLDYKSQFNLNSPNQLQRLLYVEMGLPVIDLSKKKKPSTKAAAIKKLLNHTQDPDHLEVLNALIAFKQVDKILTAFIPAFLAAPLASDGVHYLFGSFNVGGTLSGRLSSSNVNLQQLPATGSIYAKLVKGFFKAPKGWLFVGLDFNGLEDRISALTTKDPNKLAVYIDGYDGHSLRAFYYFRDQMPNIVNTVVSINSIQTLHKKLRQASKAPTFALTYQGTYKTLMNNCGFSEAVAKGIEAAYHDLYAVSDKWVQDKLQQACKDGFVTVAFGLRVRTPLLKQCILGTRKTPHEAEAEARTAGNAMGQSYGLLNSRAAMEFGQRFRRSIYKHDIRPCAQIHDAQYYLVRDDADLIAWVNQHLVECVSWDALPEIQHPIVKLGGELSIFYPSWAEEINIPNGANAAQIRALAIKSQQKEAA